MGVMVAGWGMHAYVAREALGSGGNLSCTVLYLTLVAMASARPLGACFNVLLDNTCADNKNNTVIFFLGWLVAMDVFDETSTFMMMKGHTYSRIDQAFRTLIVRMMAAPVWTVSMLLHSIFDCLRPYNCVLVDELPHVWDFERFFEPHIHEKFGGFATGQFGSGMHEIRCRKDKEGNVRVWFRKSSQASNWLPEDGGYEMFKSVPEGPPPVAKAKPDKRWNREAVENNVRSWFRYMPVSLSALTKIRTEWENMFESLPPNGDTTQLPDEQKLKWTALPKRRSAATQQGSGVDLVGGSSGSCRSSALENPPINPITGPGRSFADVNRELSSHRDFMRRQSVRSAVNGAQPCDFPVFQSDFLLIRRQSELVLHRVAHGLMIDDATHLELSFTTIEYEHTPQPGVPGLFGTFAPKV